MICLRTSYRYIYDYPRTNYRYVYDLSPYQLQICLWPVSVTATAMSMTYVRTNSRYVYDLYPH